MKFQAKWKIPQVHGGKVFDGKVFEQLKDAELDAFDARVYDGVISWVEPVLEPGETPHGEVRSESEAALWRSSGWWRNLPAHVVALAQARQQCIVMPPAEFIIACTKVLGHAPPTDLSPTDLFNLLRTRT